MCITYITYFCLFKFQSLQTNHTYQSVPGYSAILKSIKLHVGLNVIVVTRVVLLKVKHKHNNFDRILQNHAL